MQYTDPASMTTAQLRIIIMNDHEAAGSNHPISGLSRMLKAELVERVVDIFAAYATAWDEAHEDNEMRWQNQMDVDWEKAQQSLAHEEERGTPEENARLLEMVTNALADVARSRRLITVVYPMDATHGTQRVRVGRVTGTVAEFVRRPHPHAGDKVGPSRATLVAVKHDGKPRATLHRLSEVSFL